MQDGVWIILSGSCKFPFAFADRICFPICHCEAPTGPWRPEREARGSALGVQFRSTWPDNRKVSGEYGTVTRRGVEDAATYKVCAVGDGLHEPQVPSRDCRVALLLAMTHQAGAAAHQCPSAVELPCTRRSLSAAAFFSRAADLYGSPQPTEKYPKFGNKGQNYPFYATRICHTSQLVKHYFFEKGIDLFLICVMLFL